MPSEFEKATPIRSYYFEFTATGHAPVDRILSAVARAGKAYHHTDEWQEEGYIDAIQEAAVEAVNNHERLVEALEIIAGERPCLDNLMSDKDIARAALDPSAEKKEK